jgi:hypothetical protein
MVISTAINKNKKKNKKIDTIGYSINAGLLPESIINSIPSATIKNSSGTLT